jgi:hypothetical protein
MNRATIVYIVMIGACAAGLWVVLAAGSNLVAPEDFAGKWTLASTTPAGPAIPMAPYGPGMTVDQSGRFFQIAFDNGPRLNLTMTEPGEVMPVPGQQVERVELTSAGWLINLWGKPDGDQWIVHLVGPTNEQSGKWIAKRVSATFQPSSSAAGGH